MKKAIIIAVCLILIVGIFGGCQAKNAETSETPAQTAETAVAEEAASGEYNVTLGCIQPGPEYYYQTLFDCIRTCAESVGMNVVTLLSQYSADTELSNIEDLISQDVDAIMMFAVSGDSGQVAAQTCEAADMPLFLVDASATEGASKPVCCIKKDFYESGFENGQWLADNYEGEMKIAEITSTLGAGIAEPTSQGFMDALAARDDVTLVSQNAADWDRAKAIGITEDLVSAGEDINLIFVHNEDMAAGVVSALEEADMLGEGKIQVVSQNGSPEGLEMIRKGQLLSTCSTNPSTQAGYSVAMYLKYLDGQEVPEIFDNPVYMFDASNVDDPTLATWDVSWALSIVNEYLSSK